VKLKFPEQQKRSWVGNLRLLAVCHRGSQNSDCMVGRVVLV